MHLGSLRAFAAPFSFSLFSFVSLSLLVGCGDDADPDPSSASATTVILEEGTGEENQEPLWTLHPGNRFGTGEPWMVLDAVELGGRAVFPVGRGDHGSSESRGVPSEPASWFYLSHDKDGSVLFHGQPREGATAPALLVPAKVKVGMKWRTGNSPGACEGSKGNAECVDDPRFTIEVLQREVKDTIFGLRPVWLLKVTDWRRYADDGKNFFPDGNIYNGVPFMLELVEGRGPRYRIGVDDTLTPGDQQFAVTVLGPSPTPIALPKIELRPAELEDIEGRMGMGATGYLDPSRFGDTTIVGNIGEEVGFGQTFIEFAGGGGASLEAWYPFASLACRGPNALQEADCDHAAALAIASDGQSSKQIALTPIGDSIAGRASEAKDGDYIPFVHLLAVFENAPGRFEVLRSHRAGLQRGELQANIDLSAPTGIPNANTPLDQLYTVAPKHWPFRARDNRVPGVGATPFGSLVVQPDDSGLRALALGVGGLTAGASAQVNGGALRFAHLDDDQTTGYEHVALPRVGHVNVFARPGGHDILLSTFAGRIDEVVVEADGVRLRPIGDVEVPEGEFMVGALPLGDELLIFTQAEYEGVDSFYVRGYPDCPQCEGIERTVRPSLGRIRAWRAAKPAAAEARRPAPIWSLDVQASGADMQVCWAPGHGAPPTEGWTLGGHPPAAVTVVGGEDRCVLLVRDTALPDLLAEDAAWMVEGTLPDGTRVAVGTSYAEVLNQRALWLDESETQPWAGSSFIGGRLRDNGELSYGTAGLWPQNHTVIMEETRGEFFARGDYNLEFGIIPDLGGDGGWAPQLPDGLNDDGGVGHIDNNGVLRRSAAAPSLGVPISNACAGGGLLFPAHHLAADDTVTLLPTAAAELGSLVLRFANGTVCGTGADQVGQATYDDRVHAPLACARTGSNEDELVRARMPAHLLTGTLRDGPVLSPDGSAYFVYQTGVGPIGEYTLVRLDSETLEFEEIDLEAWGLSSELIYARLSMTWTIDDEAVPLAVLTVHEPASNDRILVRFEAEGPKPTRRIELQTYRHIDRVFARKDGDLILVTSGGVAPVTEGMVAWAQSSLLSSRPDVLRIPYESGRDRLTPAPDTAEPEDPLDGSSCDPRPPAALGITSPNSCPQLSLVTNSGDRDQPKVVTLIRDDGKRTEIPAWTGEGCPAGTCTGFDGPGDTRRWHRAQLEPFRRYVVEVGAAPYPTRMRVATGNHGSVIDLSVNGELNFVAPIDPKGPVLTTRNLVRTYSDPTRKRGLSQGEAGSYLLERTGTDPSQITVLPAGGVFSPDGRWVVGPSPAPFAYHIETGTFAELAPDLVSDPVDGLRFSLPEHGLVHFGRLDGSGVVLRLEADGRVTELAQTPTAVAGFTGDGRHAYYVVHPGGATVGAADLIRLDLETGATAVAYTFPTVNGVVQAQAFTRWLHPSSDGSFFYAYNETTTDIFVYSEGQAETTAPYDLAPGFRNNVGFVSGGRSPGMLAVVDSGAGARVLMRHDPQATPGNEFVLVPQLTLESGLREAIAGVDALVVLDGGASGGTASVVRSSDGEVMHTIPKAVDLWKWPTGELAVLADDCAQNAGPSCRSLTRLSDDGVTIVEVVTDAGQTRASSIDSPQSQLWTFGPNRSREFLNGEVVDSSAGEVVYPGPGEGEFPASTLDLPCLPVTAPENYSAWTYHCLE